MRLLQYNDDGELSLTKDFVGGKIPTYAILSHTWGANTEEVTYRDLINGTGKDKSGYEKIRFCAKQARHDCLQFFWIDTCCIDLSNSSELSEAINSMFRWYRNAVKCYVYLSDVSTRKRKASDQSSECTWESAFRMSRWFTRGWTLQELIAPASVEFFSQEHMLLGDKKSMERQVHEITKIAVSALRGSPLYQFSVEERLSWAQNRETTREEDAAYSLFGIFDINLPVIYGEGMDKAFRRLINETDTSRVSLAPSTQLKIYRSLEDSGFRILILNPGTKGSEITAYIQNFNLLEPPDYNALSYAWGHEPAIHHIDVNHRQMFIRPNLFHALQRVRARNMPVFLWIDSLCINQSNKAEMNTQVGRMAEIYRNAKNVLIWLGEEDSYSKIGMDFIPKIIGNDFRWDGVWWESEEFKAFNRVLGRSWFRRRWVIQEAAFSANSVMLCGDRQVHMNDFARAVSVVRTKLGDTLTSFHVPGKDASFKELLANFHDSPATRLLDIIKNAFHRSNEGDVMSRRLSLETLVDLATLCETTDPRDTIFALISLANDTESHPHAEPTTKVIADYSSNLLDVFANFILHCCHKSGSLDIICRPWAPVSRSVTYTKGKVSRLDQAYQVTVSSWIASKDYLPFGSPLREMTRRLHGKPLVGSSQRRTYNAHYGTKPQVHLGRSDTTNACDGSLHAKGIVLGEITQRSTRMADAIITKECLDILGKNSLDQHSDSIYLPDAIWRTLCANRDERGEPAPLSYQSLMVQVLQFSSQAPISVDSFDHGNSISDIDVEELLETEMSEDVEKFLETIRDVVWNRRTFRGERNCGDGSAIVGLIPQHAEAGDQVCVLYGCSIPVVLRKHSHKNNHHWQLIGEAYVDGFMEGEQISSMSQAMLKSAEVEFKIR